MFKMGLIFLMIFYLESELIVVVFLCRTRWSFEMAVVATPLYAPEDPTLPKPWKGLLDGNTGSLYFWNQETNVTQYEKPGASSVQVQRSIIDDDERYNRVSNGGSKFDFGSGTHQVLILYIGVLLYFFGLPPCRKN